MGLLEDGLKGLAIGVGAMVGVKLLSQDGPATAGGPGRSLAKQVVRGYLSLRDKIREAGAETREQFSDMVAEVRAERQQPHAERVSAEPGNGERTARKPGPARRRATARTAGSRRK